MSKQQDGFTLVELMLVVAVIGVLAAVILFAVGPFQEGAGNAKSTTDETSCSTARVAADATSDGSDTATDFASGCNADGTPK